MLRCSKCGEMKPHESFRKRSGISRGYQYPCKSCTTPEKRSADLQWASSLKRNYGIDEGQYEAILMGQGGCCKLCGDNQCQSGRRFAVDHCHKTGVVRGLLCYNCNTGLGKFRDNPDVLRKAAEYVEVFQES